MFLLIYLFIFFVCAPPAPSGGIAGVEHGSRNPAHVLFTVGTPPDGHAPPSNGRCRHFSGEADDIRQCSHVKYRVVQGWEHVLVQNRVVSPRRLIFISP